MTIRMQITHDALFTGHYNSITYEGRSMFSSDSKTWSKLLFVFFETCSHVFKRESIVFQFLTDKQIAEILSSRTSHICSRNICAMVINNDELLVIQAIRDDFLDVDSTYSLQLSRNQYLGENKNYSKNTVLNIYELSNDGYAKAIKDTIEHSLAKPIEIR